MELRECAFTNKSYPEQRLRFVNRALSPAFRKHLDEVTPSAEVPGEALLYSGQSKVAGETWSVEAHLS